ncbi:MAG: hypothetical protein Q8O13_00055 [Candidatus Omnitrophota bacterium]|nr:hypothetical protein [Candidatus Omnitrophota bacterium]
MNIKISPLIFTFILLLSMVTLAAEVDKPVVKNLTLDKKNKTIFYELTEPATVRIRVGSKSGPLYRTLVNWQKQKKGRHNIKWDGLDSSGNFNILDNKDFTFSFNYYLPYKDEPIIREYLESDLIILDNFIGRALKLVHLSQIHKNHKQQHCGDLNVLFELPNNIEKSKQGLAKIKGICPIVIKLSEKDKSWFRQERFGINIFIDDIFVKGEALGYTPYTWNFDSKGINKGKHLITVNLKGFNDHIAVGSLPIYVE